MAPRRADDAALGHFLRSHSPRRSLPAFPAPIGSNARPRVRSTAAATSSAARFSTPTPTSNGPGSNSATRASRGNCAPPTSLSRIRDAGAPPPGILRSVSPMRFLVTVCYSGQFCLITATIDPGWQGQAERRVAGAAVVTPSRGVVQRQWLALVFPDDHASAQGQACVRSAGQGFRSPRSPRRWSRLLALATLQFPPFAGWTEGWGKIASR